MRLIFTKSNKPLSLLIRAITGQDSSHFAFVFETAAKGLMFESNLFGTHPTFYANSKKHFTVVHEKVVDLPVEIEDKIWDLVVDKYDGKSYDFCGAIYLGLMILRERLFKIPRPLKNKWAKDGEFFCDELYEIFNSLPKFIPVNVHYGMDTPEDVWNKIKDWEY